MHAHRFVAECRAHGQTDKQTMASVACWFPHFDDAATKRAAEIGYDRDHDVLLFTDGSILILDGGGPGGHWAGSLKDQPSLLTERSMARSDRSRILSYSARQGWVVAVRADDGPLGFETLSGVSLASSAL